MGKMYLQRILTFPYAKIFIFILVAYLIIDLSKSGAQNNNKKEIESRSNLLNGQIKALWVFSGDIIPDAAARLRLVEHSSQSGVTDLYASIYRSTPNSNGRLMFEEDMIADLISRSHMKNQKVWAAYGSPEFSSFPCDSAAFPIKRMLEVAAYNNSRAASERLDGVVLDVEPKEPLSESDYQALISHYQCVRDFLPPEIKLAVAIRFFWDDPVAFPDGGKIKPAYQHISDLDIDNIIVMGYRDYAGTDTCSQNGIICVDKDEINYATSINKPGQILVGLETLDPSTVGISNVETFFEEGQIQMSGVMREVRNYFSNRSGFGGFATHNYNSVYLSGLSGWESPFTSSVVFQTGFKTDSDAEYVTSGNIRSSKFSVTRSGADWGARLHHTLYRLQLTNDTDAANVTNEPGWVFAGIPTSNFDIPYNSVLGMNTGQVNWNFNMRQVRDDPGGFGETTFGVAFVLGATSANVATEGNGYAVVLGQSGAIDPIRLVKFTGGLKGAMTDLIVSNTQGLTDFGSEYLSVRVSFNPKTSQWELFLRNDGLTEFAEPNMGTLVLQGSAVNWDYVGTPFTFLGGYWQGFTQTQQTAFFDSIAVSVSPLLAPTAASVSLGGRVVKSDGRGISNAVVTIRGGGLQDSMVTITNPLGYYRFKNIPAGQIYFVTVRSKRFINNEQTEAITLYDDLLDLNFIVKPQR